MAELIPIIPKKCPNSERYVYQRLGRELPDDWIVLHSLGFASHETKIWGETDIVVLSPAGVFALEIKGGKVECKGGLWHYSGGDFKPFTKNESPWSQASGCMVAIRKRLREADPSFRKVLFGFGVVMPYTPFTTTGFEITPEVLLDKRSFKDPLDQYIERLRWHWTEDCARRKSDECQGLSPAQLRRARQILRPDFETAFSLGSYLTGVENQIIQLTNEQIRASRRMAANPRTVVRGRAGTGKSILAVERARQLAAEGHHVLFLCYNQLLAAHVRASIASEPWASSVDVWHIHALYRHIIDRAGIADRLDAANPDDEGFFPRLFPQIAAEALCTSSIDGWDVLIVDEAQDILTPDHLDALDLLLKDGLRTGRWHLFLDRHQNIYGHDVEEMVEKRLAEGSPAFDDLFENCRNTRQVAIEASIVSGIDLAIAGAPEGPPTKVHYYSTPERAVSEIDGLLRKLIDDDISAGDVAILSTRRAENSLLAGRKGIADRKLVDPSNENDLLQGGLLFTTMHAFKGLERQAVIAIDMDELGDAIWAKLHYAGLSRARCLLHVFLPASAKPAYESQAVAFGQRLRTSPA
ncbi:MAG: NERD domain-containing protein [Rhodospirillaceae bacterium]